MVTKEQIENWLAENKQHIDCKGKKVEKLNEKQEEFRNLVREYFEGMAYDTGEINREATEKYLRYVMAMDSDYPKEFSILYYNDPVELQAGINRYEKLGFCDPETDYKWMLDEKVAGTTMTHYNLSYYADISNYSWTCAFFFWMHVGISTDEFREYQEMFLPTNFQQFAKLDKLVLVCRKPVDIHVDSRGRLHNPKGAAVTWKTGRKMYFVKGLEVPSSWVTTGVKVEDIEAEDNAELRRIAMELYGYKEYMLDSGAEMIAQDEYGQLWKKEVPNDEPIVMVSMLNSTPEPEFMEGLEQRQDFRPTEDAMPGAWFKRYMLRVPPTVTTPVEGLAWVQKKSVEDYKEHLLRES